MSSSRILNTEMLVFEYPDNYYGLIALIDKSS